MRFELVLIWLLSCVFGVLACALPDFFLRLGAIILMLMFVLSGLNMHLDYDRRSES